MATEAEELRSAIEEEEEGGPVKPFLEHLEDLRWVLIKVVVSLLLAMIVCLIAGDKVVGLLKRPLDQARISYPANVQVLTFLFGTNRLGVIRLGPDQRSRLALSTNRFDAFDLVPVWNGSNWVLGLERNDRAAADTGHRIAVDLNNFSPIGGFIVALQVAFYGGMVLAAPFILYFVAQFVFPALKLKERKYVHRGLLFGGGLFMLGVAFCYFVLMPTALAVAQQYSQWLGFSATQWRAEEYIGFVCKFMLGMGLGFEMPVVILTLVKIGVVTYSGLAKFRRYMILVNLVIGALLTSPDVLTQVMMAVPLQLLYELSVWIAWYWERRDRRRARESEPSLGTT